VGNHGIFPQKIYGIRKRAFLVKISLKPRFFGAFLVKISLKPIFFGAFLVKISRENQSIERWVLYNRF